MSQSTLYTITAHGFKAVISTLGAELKSLVNIKTGEEYIWSGEPTIWQGTAPILFPIVGRLKNGQYKHQGKSYEMAKHGFARNSVFDVISHEDSTIQFRLSASTQTRQQYPFNFVFSVFFSLQADGLSVRYEVHNSGEETMLFTLGSHPAFSLPLDGHRLDDYYLQFEHAEQLDAYFLAHDLLCSEPIHLFLDNQRTIPITKQLFKNDALIFQNIQSRSVSIYHKKTGRRLRLHLGEAPHFGIWAKPGASFICLEPWFSVDDTNQTDGQIEHKPGILRLTKNATFNSAYHIEI